jgi:regulatory protein
MSRKKPMESALYLLKLRDRSSGEIKEKMERKGFLKEEIEATMKDLTEKGLLDDQRFVENYLRYQLQLKPQGKYRLKMRLIQLHLENDLINQALNRIESKDEIELAKKAAQKWLNQKEKLPVEKKREKLARYLAGQGFGWEVIKAVIVQLLDC